MVKAVIKLRGGRISTVTARDFAELFEMIRDKDIAGLEANVISVRDMRQGKDRSAATFHN
jgi:hypothetical protein